MQFNNSATIDIYPPDRQGIGSFDGGKITEIKPIDFPGGTSQTQRMGPLFYWAWASARGDGVIGLHPHKGFEIISYVLEGEIGHSDTLGTKSRVSAGGAQVMQTGSGVSHQEEMFGEKTEFFQIWFEPHFHEAVKMDATYGEYQQGDFQVTNEDGVRVKKVIGEGAPVSLVAEVEMDDITLQPGQTHRRNLAAGRILAAVTVSGEGIWLSPENEDTVAVKSRYFSVIEAAEDTEVVAQANRESELRLVIIEVPRKVGYPYIRGMICTECHHSRIRRCRSSRSGKTSRFLMAPEDQREDLLDATVAIKSHGHDDTAELRNQLNDLLEPVEA